MKQNINEISKLKRLAGIITENEYQESIETEGKLKEARGTRNTPVVYYDMNSKFKDLNLRIEEIQVGDYFVRWFNEDNTILEAIKIVAIKKISNASIMIQLENGENVKLVDKAKWDIKRPK